MLNLFPYQSLLHWHSQNGRHHLPWRDFDGQSEKNRGYRVWLSEILLQQTQVDRGIGYFEKIIEAFPTVEDLARTPYEEFFSYYKWLGYYSRARNMLAAAQIVSREHAGIFPKDSESLRALPGVGPYTAEAIRAFAYEIPTLSFDTNLEKIFARYYHGSRFLKLTRDEKSEILESFEKSNLSARAVNGALMDFASSISNNKKWVVDFDHYPLEGCKFAETRGELEIEEVKTKVFFPSKDSQIVVILHADHRAYFSSSPEKYSPFVLPPTEWDIRHFVQQYFETNHSLELSVRPVHHQEYRDGRPFIHVHAQVQRGSHAFKTFSKSDKDAALASM